MTIKYELSNVAVCLPDFFSGSQLSVVQVPVLNTTTYGKVKEMLLNWTNTDHIEELDFEQYNVAVEELFANIQLDVVPDCFAYIEDCEDEDCLDSVYMFFTIRTVEEDGE